MLNYPREGSSLKALSDAWLPPEDIAAEYEAAASIIPPPVRTVAIFDLLKTRTDLDQDGVRLVLGCAHLINIRQWYEKAEEALLFVAANISRLVPEDPQGDLP